MLEVGTSPRGTTEGELMDWKAAVQESCKEAPEICDQLIAAIEKLFLKDDHLLKVDANERSITHRLAIYLEEQFPNHDVDCEYNRKGDIPNRIVGSGFVNADDTNGRTVYPDIIWHKRGDKPINNYLVIEVKKEGSPNDDDDLDKLKAYQDELHYQFAIFLEFRCDAVQPGLRRIHCLRRGSKKEAAI